MTRGIVGSDIPALQLGKVHGRELGVPQVVVGVIAQQAHFAGRRKHDG